MFLVYLARFHHVFFANNYFCTVIMLFRHIQIISHMLNTHFLICQLYCFVQYAFIDLPKPTVKLFFINKSLVVYIMWNFFGNLLLLEC